MASSVMSTAAVASINRAAPAQASMVAPFTGLKSTAAFPASRKSLVVADVQLTKEVDYLLRNGWIPCLEFSITGGFVFREHSRTPGYYDGRYWTMWKLPMFGCTDSIQVIKEIGECVKEYPDAFVRIIGFDNLRQVQCISFIAAKPEGY